MRLFRARWRARLLVRDLIEKLSRPSAFGLLDGQIIIQPDRPGEAAETVFIGIRRRRIRLLDSIYVRYAGIDVWLPLLARLRLRRVVRCVVAEETRQGLLPSPKATKDVAGRRSYDTEDTDDLGR